MNRLNRPPTDTLGDFVVRWQIPIFSLLLCVIHCWWIDQTLRWFVEHAAATTWISIIVTRGTEHVLRTHPTHKLWSLVTYWAMLAAIRDRPDHPWREVKWTLELYHSRRDKFTRTLDAICVGAYGIALLIFVRWFGLYLRSGL